MEEIKKISAEEAKKILRTIETCDLVKELEMRSGVSAIEVDPYARTKISTEGPAIVLIVID